MKDFLHYFIKKKRYFPFSVHELTSKKNSSFLCHEELSLTVHTDAFFSRILCMFILYIYVYDNNSVSSLLRWSKFYCFCAFLLFLEFFLSLHSFTFCSTSYCLYYLLNKFFSFLLLFLLHDFVIAAKIYNFFLFSHFFHSQFSTVSNWITIHVLFLYLFVCVRFCLQSANYFCNQHQQKCFCYYY